MLKFYRLILILALASTCATAQARTRGMIINDDSVQLSYLTEANDVLPYRSRQGYSLIVAKERDPRNLLLSTDAELLEFERPFMQTRTFSPKVGLAFTDYLDHTFLALSGGAILRQPPDKIRKYSLLAEFMAGPHLHDWSKSLEWTWSLRAQINYPLADDVEFNFGLRRIVMKLENRHRDSFETGLYIGLSSRY